MAAIFNTIHIFGFGDVQLIGSEKNGKVLASSLTKLAAFVNHIKSFKPTAVEPAEYHAIHIFANSEVRYLGSGDLKTKKHFSVKISELDSVIFNDFVNEVITAVPVESN